MGQLTAAQTNTQTFGGTPVTTPAAIRHSAATSCTMHFENQDAAAQGFSARLYWTATDTFDTLNEVGSQVSGNHAYLAPVDVTFSLSGVAAGFLWGWWQMDSPGFVGTITLTMFDDVTYCLYGGQVKPTGTDYLTIDPQLLINVFGAIKNWWWWPIVAPFMGTLFDVRRLCINPRPSEPVWTALELLELASAAPPSLTLTLKAETWLQWALWPQLCECAPGALPVIDEPVLVPPKPPSGPAGPLTTFTCDNTNICGTLEQLLLAVDTLQQTQSRMFNIVQLIQRQHVPFGYGVGTVHAGLTGQGEFDVSDILGLAVDLTTLPGSYASHGGDPPTYHQLGKITVGTAEGWERSWQPTHNPYLILDISGAVTKVGWNFASGIIGTITTLVRV